MYHAAHPGGPPSRPSRPPGAAVARAVSEAAYRGAVAG